MKKDFVMPLDSIEILDGELEMVLGGFMPMPDGVNGGSGCGCGCGCINGSGCGCGCECANGSGCGCGCGATTEAPVE